MQKNIRFSEGQLMYLASKARVENSMSGNLFKRSSDMGRWQQRFFVLYQNVLFYFENEAAPRPSGVAMLEGSYCDRIITPAGGNKGKDDSKQVSGDQMNVSEDFLSHLTWSQKGPNRTNPGFV